MTTPGHDQFAITGGNFHNSAFGTNAVGTQNNYGGSPADLAFRQQVTASLQEIRTLLARHGAELSDAEGAQDELDAIEEALRENPPNVGKIQRALRALKQYAAPVSTLVTAITGVIEAITAH